MRFDVSLERPDQLFVADPPLPSSPHYGPYTVEPALAVVRRESWRPRRGEAVVVDLALPADQIRPGLADELTGAARRWFEVADRVDDSVGRAETGVGIRTFVPSLTLFLVLIVVSFVVLRIGRELDETFVRALGQGLTVAAWVILWMPVERIAGHALAARARARRSRALAGVRVEVRAAG